MIGRMAFLFALTSLIVVDAYANAIVRNALVPLRGARFGQHQIYCAKSNRSWKLEIIVSRRGTRKAELLFPYLVRRYGARAAYTKRRSLLSRCGRLSVPTPFPSPTATPAPQQTYQPPQDPEQLPVLGVNTSLKGNVPFPPDNPWNADISSAPVDPNSENLISSIGLNTGLHPDFGSNPDYGIPYIVVAGSQNKVSVSFDYADESDPGPYPIPADPPIEGGGYSSGDRHILMIDRDNWLLYELYSAYLSGGRWSAGSGAMFDLKSNSLRPAGWTSADAAGLPIFPGLVRYDEVSEQGSIPHALRFTVQHTRRAYVSPARHYASSLTGPNLPPMGMRVRLKANVDISRFSPRVQVILQALKKFGMIVADNGSNWFISGASDPRWNDDELRTLNQITGKDFEVVQMGQIVTD